jgi:hypothetical protein
MARLLLQQPFELYVVSRPFDAFPQELCLRFGLNLIWKHQSGGGSIGRTQDYTDLGGCMPRGRRERGRELQPPASEGQPPHAARSQPGGQCHSQG